MPANATLDTIAAGLARVLNTGRTLTKIAAYRLGDRIELRSTDLSRTASQAQLGGQRHR